MKSCRSPLTDIHLSECAAAEDLVQRDVLCLPSPSTVITQRERRGEVAMVHSVLIL